MYVLGNYYSSALCGCADHLDLRCLRASVEGAVGRNVSSGPAGHAPAGGGIATAAQPGVVGRLAQGAEKAAAADCHRQSRGPLSRAAATGAKRNSGRQVAAGHDALPRLCHGLCGPQRLSLHAGDGLDSPGRFAHRRRAAAVATGSQVRRESASGAAGSRLFQCRSRALLAGRPYAILDAYEGGRTTATRREQGPHQRAAVLRAEARRLGSSYLARWKRTRTTGDRASLRLLPELRRLEAKAWPLRSGLCLLGVSPRLDPLGSTDLPATIRHRDQLSPDGAGPHSHHHPRSAAAAAVRRDRAAAAQCVGLATSDAARITAWRGRNVAPGAAPLHPPAPETPDVRRTTPRSRPPRYIPTAAASTPCGKPELKQLFGSTGPAFRAVFQWTRGGAR